LRTATKVTVSLLLTLRALADPGALPDIATIKPDLQPPAISDGQPAAGCRVPRTTAGWEGTEVHHALYLPTNWKPGGKHPVLVEYAGNGGFRNKIGDTCDGTVEGCRLGYGISGGVDYIWVAMPFVKTADGKKENASLWWGDPDETVRYCVATVRQVCREFGGDEKSVVLCGFSRGSIACNYIGLRNDTIAPLWRAFVCHSHYDGVRTSWPYADADRASASVRLRRLAGRPQFISHEGTTAETRRYLESAGVQAPFTFVDLPFRNHTDAWVLRDCEPRRKVRAWLRSLGLPSP
jgi:predicted esterase